MSLEAGDIYTTLAVRQALPELVEILKLVERLPANARVETLATIRHEGVAFPLVAIGLGPLDPTTPILALFGGVHGLERIGTRVVIAYLRMVLALSQWDGCLQELLGRVRLLLFPLVNPVGMYLQRRSNGNRVDLMRNAPVDAEDVAGWQLYSGHRLSERLPWYRGSLDEPMQIEARVVYDLIVRELFPARIALSVDVHSGYGKKDRLWFPYAKTREPFFHVPEVMMLKELLDSTYPHHVYQVEPQSRAYLAHGDLWDYCYDNYRSHQPDGHFIPFTLELGSWLWVKKNWSQLFSRLGAFNPWLPHREQRTLRRHLPLFDFLLRAVGSSVAWEHLGEDKRTKLFYQGLDDWYGHR